MQNPPIAKTQVTQKTWILLILSCLGILGLGLFMSWFNTGDIFSGMHTYGCAIIVMIIGDIMIFVPRPTVAKIGITMLTAGLLFLFMGMRV